MDLSLRRELPASIAVLPFRTNAISPTREHLALGVCDALITRLGNEQNVLVRPTGAVRAFTDPDRNSVEIGKMQGVESVLDGNIQEDEGRLRITVQLIDTLTSTTIWSSQFDVGTTNLLDLQDSISRRISDDMIRDLVPPT